MHGQPRFLLAEVGLSPEDVTKGMLKKAAVAFRANVVEGTKAEVAELTWREPVRETNDLSTWDIWMTECLRYRVVRSISSLSEGESYFCVSFIKGSQQPNAEAKLATLSHRDKKMGTDTPKRFRVLEAAVLAAEELYKNQTGADRVRSNKREIIELAEKHGLNVLPSQTQPSGQEEDHDMYKIEESVARRVLTNSGLAEAASAETMSRGKLLKRINGLTDIEGIKEPESAEDLEVFKKICGNVARGSEIQIVSDGHVESNGEAKKNGNGKASSGKKKDAKPKAAKARKEGDNKMSCIDAAAKVTSDKGEPLGTSEMIELMAKKGLWTSPGGKTPAATLYSAILREIGTKGKDSRFKKTERGKFAVKS